MLRIFAPTYVKLILRILRTSVLSNTENIENFSFDFKLGSQKCSQLTFLMKSGYLTTAKCLSNQICKKDLKKNSDIKYQIEVESFMKVAYIEVIYKSVRA